MCSHSFHFASLFSTTLPSFTPAKAQRFAGSLIAVSVGLVLLCIVTGRITPHQVPDTPSYLEYSFASAEDIATQIRTPGYPVILRLIESISPSSSFALQAVVILQIALHALAVVLWYREMRLWGIPQFPATLGCLALSVTNTFWDHIDTIATDAISMSLSLIVLVCVSRIWRSGNAARQWITAGLLSTLVIMIRPAYLFLIPWLFLAMIVRPAGAVPVRLPRRLLDAGTIVTIPLIAMMIWCGFRGKVTGDYGVLPFGHQNMAAVTTQLLSNDELTALPGADGELGAAIGKSREQLMGVTDATTATMTIEERWDDMTYSVVIKVAQDEIGQTIIEQHQGLARLDTAIVQAYPLRYVRWWLLSIRRGFWGSLANIAMHPVYFPCLMGLVGLAMWRCLIDTRVIDPKPVLTKWTACKPLWLITMSYAFSKIAFVGLTSPTIGRFSDAAMVLVPTSLAVIIGLCVKTSDPSWSISAKDRAER